MASIELRLDDLFGDEGRLEPGALAEFGATRFADLHARFQADRRSGKLAALDVPEGDDVVESIRRFAEGAGQAFENVVVLGIGGAAPGARALLSSLLTPWWNELGAEERDYYPRLYVVDSIDPETVAPFLRHVAAARSLYNVISRSGSNPGTAALFLAVKRTLATTLGEGFRRHLVFTTDPDGPLGQVAASEGVAALPYPRGVPGRFSILSAVGLLPAALVGIEIDELLAGAREVRERCASPELEENPAGRLAVALYLTHVRAGARMQVMIPCADRLAAFGPWFRQLWSEARDGASEAAGEVADRPVPMAIPHGSWMGLIDADPGDGVVVFVTVRESLEDLEIPSEQGAAIPELSAVGGLHLGELLRRRTTAAQEALRSAGRPSLVVELDRLTPRTVGGLLMLLQLAAVYAAGLYGQDPLREPG